MEPLAGIAGADALLGQPFPLPAVPLPLARWVEVRRMDDGVEVEWNLDDTRPGAVGRLALYAGPSLPPAQLDAATTEHMATPQGWTVTHAPLEAAQPSLRPVVEIAWAADGLHLRLTAQGPWALVDVLRIAQSVS